MPPPEISEHELGPGAQNQGYRGRVRTGCLTCRARKVRCDERRPVCENCDRVKRSCVYKSKTKPVRREPASSQPLDQAIGTETDLVVPNRADPGCLEPVTTPDGGFLPDIAPLHWHLQPMDDGSSDFLGPSTSELISRDIYLTTTIDFLAACEIPTQPSFTFFVQSVDCPFITPFDPVNWYRMKIHVARLANSHMDISTALSALQALYRAQHNGLPTSNASSLYTASKLVFDDMVQDDTKPFDDVLTAAFLLSLFEVICYESVSVLKEPHEKLVRRFEQWVNSKTHSPLSLRIVAWLDLLHATAIRSGGPGLVSPSILRLLRRIRGTAPPSLKDLSLFPNDTLAHLYDTSCSHIFYFHLRLQRLSSEIAMLTHYHRSRVTLADQEEVSALIQEIHKDLVSLWESRCDLQRMPSARIRTLLSIPPEAVRPVTTLVNIANAAYHAELVEIGRVLGDPVSLQPESRQAVIQIRRIIDDERNETGEEKLSAAYLRPLFLCAIESLDDHKSRWAVDGLRSIRDPIVRSNFFASFASALSNAQLQKDRRVTSRYFCFQVFGVSPPFM